MGNTLLEKLQRIKYPHIKSITNGSAATVEQFWDTFIVPHLPDKKIVLRWHETLMEYIKRPEAMFAIRGFNSAGKNDYDTLRRGFLSKTNEGYSFFYTDNFHAAYYLKMAIDSYVPSADEMISVYNRRLFPSRFGRDTHNERELMAIPKGIDPGIQAAGYKIAHIINVGTDYFVNGRCISLIKILNEYFDRGDRIDWIQKTDETGTYYLREFKVRPQARNYIIAEFLRFVHPVNYFLAPKPKCATTLVCSDIAEYKPLIDFVRDRYADLYGDSYYQFLKMIMVDTHSFSSGKGSTEITLSYGCNINQHAETVVPNISKETEIKMVKEYLTNPFTSFRKLEKQFMHIESSGKGFQSKKIVNSYGVTAEHKGILSQKSIEEAAEKATGLYKETLHAIREL